MSELDGSHEPDSSDELDVVAEESGRLSFLSSPRKGREVLRASRSSEVSEVSAAPLIPDESRSLRRANSSSPYLLPIDQHSSSR